MGTVGVLITPPARLSYPALITARKVEDNQKAKFQANLVFDSDADLTPFVEAAFAIAAEHCGGEEKAKKAIKAGTIHWPFHKGEEEQNPQYPEGCVVIKANSLQRPQVVSRFADPKTGKPKEIPLDEIEEECYPGCVVRASLRPYWWTYEKMKKGVSFGLGNLQKLGDGDRFDSRTAAEDDFEATETDAADLEETEEEEAPKATKGKGTTKATVKPAALASSSGKKDLSDLI